ncbi:MAG: ABC transporter permease subunit [Actinomycetota bacterium]
MSTTTDFAPTTPRHDLSFGGIIRSELLKLLSIRSSRWTYAIMAAVTVGIAAQMSSATNFAWLEGGMTQEGMQAAAVNAVAISTDISVLVVSVLGVLVIAGEYSTGMIRTTFTVVPRRVPAVLAKFLVFALVTLVIGLVAVAIAISISVSLLAGNGIDVRLDDPYYWRAMVGSVVYLVLVGLISFGAGAILRNIVGGVALAIGLVFVIPVGLGLVAGVSTPAVWLQNLTLLLPFNLGRALTAHPGYSDFASPGEPVQIPDGVWVLEPWQGALGLAAWVAVLLITAIVLVKRRDA